MVCEPFKENVSLYRYRNYSAIFMTDHLQNPCINHISRFLVINLGQNCKNCVMKNDTSASSRQHFTVHKCNFLNNLNNMLKIFTSDETNLKWILGAS